MALAALISALTMLAGQPAILLAQADSTPAPISSGAPVVTSSEDPFPAGAPTDDYGFMGWCYGALSGHMELYDRVLPEVKRIETEFPDNGDPIDKVMATYASQHQEGQDILDSYEKAMESAEVAKKTGGAKRATGIAAGRQAWAGSENADARQLAQLWMSWGLPGRCEATAARLLHRTAAR